jgi:hypothetical protein
MASAEHDANVGAMSQLHLAAATEATAGVTTDGERSLESLSHAELLLVAKREMEHTKELKAGLQRMQAQFEESQRAAAAAQAGGNGSHQARIRNLAVGCGAPTRCPTHCRRGSSANGGKDLQAMSKGRVQRSASRIRPRPDGGSAAGI